MSNTTVCEILEYENTLRDGGVPENQVRAQTKALAQIIESNLATKKDVELNGYKTILAIAVLIPTIMKILEHYKF